MLQNVSICDIIAIMKYLLGVFAIVVIMIIAIVLIVRRDPSTSQPKNPTIVMSEYANQNAIVSFTIRGKINGQSEHRAVRITVTPTERSIAILNGYDSVIERSATYVNTAAAFDTFMHALDNAGFGRQRSVTQDDDRGVCPFGQQYLYELDADGSKQLGTWSVTCGTKIGTFAGNASTIRQLFQLQIPDYNQQISGVRL